MSDIEEQRKYYERMMDEVGAEYRRRIVDLQAENAKLRELVQFMWLADYAGHFSSLPEHQEHQADVWRRMRELGVEA